MPLEIHLTEGPNVLGLSEGRCALYVGYSYQGDNLIFRVIEGRKVGTPRSYRLHIGDVTKCLEGGDDIAPLEEAEITRFEYTKQETVVSFRFKGEDGKLTISNTSREGSRYKHGSIDKTIETVYNFFGDGRGDMKPSGSEEYYQE